MVKRLMLKGCPNHSLTFESAYITHPFLSLRISLKKKKKKKVYCYQINSQAGSDDLRLSAS